jgi:hypothetical protein
MSIQDENELTDEWRRPSRSEADTACVEVCQVEDTIYLRISTAGEDGPVLSIRCDDWSDFVAGVEAGEFTPADPFVA